MSDNTKHTATEFVDLVTKYTRWPEIGTLKQEEIQVLFDILVAAGFEPKQVVLGKLILDYFTEDGRRAKKKYTVNKFCPFKVIGTEGEDDSATGWLNRRLKCVFKGVTQENKTPDMLVELMVEKIERCRLKHACLVN